MTWSSIFIASVLILFGIYEITHGYVQGQRYNLRFLLTGGILTGIPFIVAGVILILDNSSSLGNWSYLVFAGWIFGMLWETWQRRKYYQANRDQ